MAGFILIFLWISFYYNIVPLNQNFNKLSLLDVGIILSNFIIVVLSWILQLALGCVLAAVVIITGVFSYYQVKELKFCSCLCTCNTANPWLSAAALLSFSSLKVWHLSTYFKYTLREIMLYELSFKS